jgi:hypothetical protein
MAKDTVENTNKIDINWLMRAGKHKLGERSYNQCITWTTSGAWGERKSRISYGIDLTDYLNSTINLIYTTTNNYSGEKTDVDYSVDLTTTPCHFGGRHYWFLCPGNNCNRRVGALYFGSKYFLCRHCLDLSYEKRNTNKSYREFGRIFDFEEKTEKLADKLWGKYGRRFYGGKQTKTYQKYLRYSNYESLMLGG